MHDDMEFELELKGPFWVEISYNASLKSLKFPLLHPTVDQHTT